MPYVLFVSWLGTKPLTLAVDLCGCPVILPHSGLYFYYRAFTLILKTFLIETFFFFFEILKKNLRYRFYSGACCQSTQSWWLFWCCVWPHLPRYKRPHVNLSLRIICHSTSLYLRQTDGHSPLPHSTQHSYSEKTGKAAADGNAHRIFRYTGSHGGKCRYFNSIWKAR